MATEPNNGTAATLAALKAKIAGGKAFTLSPAECALVEKALGGIATDDPAENLGRVSRSLFPAGEGSESRRQNVGAGEAKAMDDDDWDDAIKEILELLQRPDVGPNGAVPRDVQRRVAMLLTQCRDSRGHGQRTETHGGGGASGSYELPAQAQDAVIGHLPRHDLYGVQPAVKRARPVSAQTAALAERLAPDAAKLRVM